MEQAFPTPEHYALLLYALKNCDNLEQVGLTSLVPFASELKKVAEVPNLIEDLQAAVRMWQGEPEMRDFSCQVSPEDFIEDAAAQTDHIQQHSRSTQTEPYEFVERFMVNASTQTENHVSTVDMAVQAAKYRSVLPRSRTRQHSFFTPNKSMRKELHSTPSSERNSSGLVGGVSTSTQAEDRASFSSPLTHSRSIGVATSSTVATEYDYPNRNTSDKSTSTR